MRTEIKDIEVDMNSTKNCKYFYTMWHKGGLKEAFETIWEITEEAFIALVSNGLYKPYCYDSRIKAYRYILTDIQHNLGLPTWLLATNEELY